MSSQETPRPVSRSDEDLHRDGVVHDVNQMLSVIVGRAAFLRDHHSDEGLRRDLDSILRAARDAAAIMKRLTSSVPAAGVSGDLRDRVNEALAAIRPPDQSSWHGAAKPGAWHAVNRVPAHLVAAVPAAEVREVLQNLLQNALTAMPQGGGVTVTGEAGQRRIRLTVADTGPGLDMAARDRVFAAGYTTSGDGFRGVGLAACRQLLARHGAQLELMPSSAGPGAVFVLDLPRGETPARPEVFVDADDDLPPLTVLVVDDEPAVRELFGDVLRSWHCTIDGVADAVAARNIFAAGRYQAALVDWNLPGEAGPDLARWLRAQDPALAVILTTGLDRERELEGTVGSAVDFTLVKPLDLDDLRRILARAATLSAARGGGGGGDDQDKEET